MKGVKYFALIVAVMVVASLLIVRDGYFTVNPGNVTIKIRFGKLLGAYDEGLYFKIPFVDDTKTFSIKIKRTDLKFEAFSKDLQPIKIDLVINHRLEKANVESIYRNLGSEYEAIIIEPIVLEEVKSVISNYSAEEVVTNRSDINKKVSEIVKARLLIKQIIATDISITDFDFTEIFLKAIEEKQIAEQEAKKAKNQVEVAKQEAEQKLERARGEAKALELQKNSISKDLIELRKVETQLKAIEKWDGKLPTYNGSGAVPFIQIKE